MEVKIPWREYWLTSQQVAEFTGFSYRYVRDVLSKDSTFPIASKHGVRGSLMWKAGEIDVWMQGRQKNVGGRPRVSSLAEKGL